MQLIQLGEIVINEKLSLIIVNGKEISLDPKLLDLLLLFCKQSDKIISRQEILDKIWVGSIVTDNAVNKLVANLRKILDDDPKSPKYIQTIPKRGYRLIYPVTFMEPSPTPAAIESLVNTAASVPLINKSGYFLSKRMQYALVAMILITIVGYISLIVRPSLINFLWAENDIPNKVTQELTRMPGIEHSALMNNNQDYIVFLREDKQTGIQQLWRKDLISNNESRVVNTLTHISRLISLTVSNEQSYLVYLAQGNKQCAVVRSQWLNEKQLSDPVFLLDCSLFRINDIAWLPEKSQLIYSATALNESSNHIYRFDLSSQTQQLLTQPDINGVGNIGLDVSPDGKKLLIVNNDGEYNSQLFVLDLISHDLTPALRVNYNISEAIWHHDSKRVLFFGPPPSHQIILSDLAGEQNQTLVSVSDYLKNNFSRIKSSQDILFSTANSNYSNRWLKQAEDIKELNNSTVFDTQPALTHQSPNYAFISTRSGQDQLYYGNLLTGDSKVISKLTDHKVFTSLAFSPNDEFLLLTEYTQLWILPVASILESDIQSKLNINDANFQANGELIQARWLTDDLLYFTVRNDKKNTNYFFDKKTNQQIELAGRWSTLATDHNQTNILYLLNGDDNQLYQMSIKNLDFNKENNKMKILENGLKPSRINIPSDYLSLKVHQQKVHYITATDNLNLTPNSYKLHIKSLIDSSEEVFPLSCNCGYDVADSGLMVSERVSLEGDIHRTIIK
jgi:DNA-binding winged helix-turn-helix (wHTH) protein/Tol biopolymer transport system component